MSRLYLRPIFSNLITVTYNISLNPRTNDVTSYYTITKLYVNLIITPLDFFLEHRSPSLNNTFAIYTFFIIIILFSPLFMLLNSVFFFFKRLHFIQCGNVVLLIQFTSAGNARDRICDGSPISKVLVVVLVF